MCVNFTAETGLWALDAMMINDDKSPSCSTLVVWSVCLRMCCSTWWIYLLVHCACSAERGTHRVTCRHQVLPVRPAAHVCMGVGQKLLG